jgi:hypothetical protein
MVIPDGTVKCRVVLQSNGILPRNTLSVRPHGSKFGWRCEFARRNLLNMPAAARDRAAGAEGKA